MTNSPDPASRKNASGINARVVLNAVTRHPLVVAGVVVLAAATAAGIWFFLPLPKHTAAVVFHIASQTQSVVNVDDGGFDRNSYRQYQAVAVKRRLVLHNALKNHPEVANASMLRGAPDQVAWLEKNVKVESRHGSEFMKVYLEGDQPEEMVSIIKAIQVEYIKDLNTQENAGLALLSENLFRAKKKLEDEIIEQEKTIRTLASSLGAGLFTDPITLFLLNSMQNDELRSVQAELREIDQQIELLDLERKSLDDQPQRSVPPAVGVVGPLPVAHLSMLAQLERMVSVGSIEDIVSRDSLVLAAEAKVTYAKQYLREVESKYAPGTVSAAITTAKEELKAVELDRDRIRADVRSKSLLYLVEKLAADRTQRKQQLNQRLDAAKRKRGLLYNRRDQIVRDKHASSEKRLDLEKAQKDIANQEKLLAAIEARLQRLEVEKTSDGRNRVTISEQPYVTAGIEGNRRAKYTGMAGVGVLLSGLAAVVWWESRSRRVTGSDDLTRSLNLPLLGTLPPLGGYQTYTEHEYALVESIDSTRTLLLHANGPNHPPLRTLVVTSGMPGEGKTTLSGHLSISLARAGFNVLLVDGDVHRPTAHTLFDVPAGPGLCEVLRGEVAPNQVIQSTRVPGLCVMPAGTWSLVARQALVGDRWEAIRRQLERQFDYVVVDSAPLLLMTDSQLLAKGADGVLVSTMIGVSRVGAVAQTQDRLSSIGARVLGLVVNGVRPPRHDSYSYRYYHKVPTDVTATGTPAVEPNT